jgi:hypothetical protein
MSTRQENRSRSYTQNDVATRIYMQKRNSYTACVHFTYKAANYQSKSMNITNYSLEELVLVGGPNAADELRQFQLSAGMRTPSHNTRRAKRHGACAEEHGGCGWWWTGGGAALSVFEHDAQPLTRATLCPRTPAPSPAA